jgi:myo-inositol 2-dehydrogenase/D-chiro-inositol 1-dehydrogenase
MIYDCNAKDKMMTLPSTSRRSFLKTVASTVSTGAVAPYILTGSVARGEAPSDKLTVAAIGVGGRGTGIGMQAASLGNMVACADVHRQNAERFANKVKERGGDCQVYQDYREIIARDDIDAITCGTPDHWHVKIAIDAMQAGKDVYCEKPLTLTIGESEQVCEATQKTGRIFQVGTQQRSEFDRRFLKAVAIARSGRLGSKLHALSSVGTATAGGPFESKPVPEFLDFDFWLGQAPVVDFAPERIGWNFRWWLEYSGGQVTDWGVHHTDIAIWALGGEETGITAAAGKGSWPGLPDDVDIVKFLNGEQKIPATYNVAQSFDVDMELPNGNTIKLLSGPNELIIEGSEGKIRVNRGGLTGRPVEEIEASDSDKKWLDEEVNKLYRNMPLNRGHMGNFFHCVKTRELPISDVFSHTKSVNACHMANIAMLLKRKITWDPQQYAFVDDAVANQLMSRKQRAPYQIQV